MKNLRNLASIAAMAAGSVLLVAGLPSPASAGSRMPAFFATETVTLSNNTADPGEDCPDDSFAYWHFITAPNDGSFPFVSITLNLGAGNPSYTGTIVKNGTQTDNVFIAVPAGSTLTSLVSGSAVISTTKSDFSAFKNFNLSHTCAGDSQPTTTTEESTTTTEEATTTSAKTAPTIPTTTALEGSGANLPTTTTIMAAIATLPKTGSDSGVVLAFGGFLVALGISMLAVNRRRHV